MPLRDVSLWQIKLVLDLNWDDPHERLRALHMVLGVLARVTAWIETQPQEGLAEAAAAAALTVAEQVKAQDVTMSDHGTAQLKKGVACNRSISVADPPMRHGRCLTSL